jgi:hypothetical protein
MRTKIVIELAKEVLGPRNGVNEVLDDNPLTEYITGVLAPIAGKNPEDIEDEQEIPSDSSETFEEEQNDVDIQTPILLHPTLDPKSRPSSMGLSFTIKAKQNSKLKICITWAKYCVVDEELKSKNKNQDKEDKSHKKWQRFPFYSTFEIDLKPEIRYFDSVGKETPRLEDSELSFNSMINWDGNRCSLDLFVVNRMKATGTSQETIKHIFQPQIRIVCLGDTSLIEGIKSTPKRPEEQELAFLYRKRPVFARGHLCSVLWRDIDPENRQNVDGKYFSNISDEDPLFSWVDGCIVPPEDRKLFSPPDLRTEFMPMYSIPFPKLDWPKEFGESPELRAGVLAELWRSIDLRNALIPFLTGYEQWITEAEGNSKDLSQQEKLIAENLVAECKQVYKRMAKGIDLLTTDEQARLSFCFANKAIDTQHRWSHKEEFIWYPFQLSFILMSLESILNKDSPERSTCDALWVSTGAGKTEAYLALIAIVFAYRRRLALKNPNHDLTGSGVSVITRYTLRLLTIQQFRRALAMIAACELLRIDSLSTKSRVGWRPAQVLSNSNFIWGSAPFSIGLWVGSAVSPNHLQPIWATDHSIPGALDILKGQLGEGEPAQILTCPACKGILAVPARGLQPGEHVFHFIVRTPSDTTRVVTLEKEIHGISIVSSEMSKLQSQSYYTFTIKISSPAALRSKDIDDLWSSIHEYTAKNNLSLELIPSRASRPGYFIRSYLLSKKKKEYDFEVFCPNPNCPLHQPWCGGTPFGWINGKDASSHCPAPDGTKIPLFFDGNKLIDVQEPFQYNQSQNLSDRIPLTCMTVEEQVFSRLPTLLVATVDKFARPPFKPSASAIFGNIEFYHCIYGYYRQYETPLGLDVEGHPSPAGTANHQNFVRLPHSLESPNLIIQDELHLIEGPLGSLVGIYETAIDFLCSQSQNKPIKYIASTATIRRAKEQINAVFLRELQLFPPHGLSSNDRFFISDQEVHPAQTSFRGRLYVGICAPGRGPMTPLRNIYARLLQTVGDQKNNPAVDNFWTLTGYFNAVRELAGARALYRQDIPQRVSRIASGEQRILDDENALELSSRTPSTDLPAILDILSRSVPNAADCLFSTSMFGTGVDISRISLMVVNGQPKTTSAYIQSTGRVGRSKGALVVTFLRASRPRDLSHYEFFTGYHRQLHRYVEPITTNPFAPGVLERTIGPLCVFLLRNMQNTTVQWHLSDTACCMNKRRTNAPEIDKITKLIALRGANQQKLIVDQEIVYSEIIRIVERKLDHWQSIAANNPNLKYVEYAIGRLPTFPVVLGDYQHYHAGLGVVYQNAPSSLRDIEETTGFQT